MEADHYQRGRFVRLRKCLAWLDLAQLIGPGRVAEAVTEQPSRWWAAGQVQGMTDIPRRLFEQELEQYSEH
jgi:hypothetical protein